MANCDSPRDVMSRLIYKEWDRSCNELFGTSYPMIFNSSKKSELDIDTNQVWSRTTIKHTRETQASIGDGSYGILFDSTGIVSVQCFIPIDMTNHFGIAETICNNIRDVLRRFKGCVWFRNCSAIEGIREKSLQGYNVTADFIYTERLL